jgi:hypothetical protein
MTEWAASDYARISGLQKAMADEVPKDDAKPGSQGEEFKRR